jgi:hypothetical protein
VYFYHSSESLTEAPDLVAGLWRPLYVEVTNFSISSCCFLKHIQLLWQDSDFHSSICSTDLHIGCHWTIASADPFHSQFIDVDQVEQSTSHQNVKDVLGRHCIDKCTLALAD